MEVSRDDLLRLVEEKKLEVFDEMCKFIDDTYLMDKAWNLGGKNWSYEYKFRKGGKTLCAFYFKDGVLGLVIIFGKDERSKIENSDEFSSEFMKIYEDTHTYHDGKWMLFDLEDLSMFEDIKKALLIKRKPNRK